MTELLAIAEKTARAAAELAFRRRAEGVEIAATKSSITDVVTAADREVEQLVLEMLHEARPNDGILGEEGASVEGTSGITWVVDPIDGTVNYLYGVGPYAVSIAAVEGETAPQSLQPTNWTSLAGVIVSPTLNEVFTAGAGRGAFVNGTQLKASDADVLSSALVATGFGYGRDRRIHQGRVFAELISEIRDIRRIGSAALDIAGVGAGRSDAYFEKGVKPWDVAAALLVASEAGCFTSIEEVDGELFAAVSAPGIASEFVELLDRTKAKSS